VRTVSFVLGDSGLFSKRVKSAMQEDIKRIEHFYRVKPFRDKFSEANYIVQSVLMLVDCKIKAKSWRNDKLIGYKRHFPTFEGETPTVKHNRAQA